MLLHQLRTKVNADHAGLSPPLALLKVLMLSLLEILFLFQNNNSLIAQRNTEIWDVMVVLWTMPSNILNPPKLNSNQLIHTEQLEELAPMMKVKVKFMSLASSMFPLMIQLNLKLQLPKVQYQLLFKLTNLSSKPTKVELSHLDVVPILTMVSSLLVLELTTEPTTGS